MKKIGVLGATHGRVFGITYPYYRFAERFGEVVLINPLSENVNENIDLLILPGGADLDPADYGAKPSIFTNKPNPVREWFDGRMLPAYIDARIPIFGICLGLQSINSFFGGTLEQHNSLYHPFSGKHRGEFVHKIFFKEEAIKDQRFNLAKVLPHKQTVKEMIEVNSLHHQAIETLGVDLISHAITHKHDESVEIIVHNELPIVGVQFHPEELEGFPIEPIMQSYIRGLLNNG